MPLIRPDNTARPSKTTAHRAGWVVVDPWTIIPNGVVIVIGDRITAVEQGWGKISADDVIDHGPGALIPAWVNAHTHLELSALKGKTRPDDGFIAWVQSVIALRESFPQKTLLDAAIAAVNDLIENGTGLVGEISTLGLTRSLFLESGLAGIWFMENLGAVFQAPDVAPGPSKHQSMSVAGHAPHTTTAELLVELKDYTRKNGRLFAIHLAESTIEQEFITTGKGTWAAFLSDRGIDPLKWEPEADGPICYCDRLGLLDDQTLAVHAVFASPADIRLLAERGARVCVCPRSNMMLHQRLPDLPAIISAGLRPALGTDSLASNDSLSMRDEMAFAARHFPSIPPAEVLAMATVYGAESLGFGDLFGTISAGKAARMQYLEVRARDPEDLLATIVSGEVSTFNKTNQH